MSDVAIPGLTIENFRCFPKLHLERLGRVNLITGRNSVGKSYLLEALELYARRGGLDILVQQMRERGELRYERDPAREVQRLAQPFETVASLFYGWHQPSERQPFTIGSSAGVIETGVALEFPPRPASADGDEQLVLEDDLRQPYLRARWNGEPVQRVSLLALGARRPFRGPVQGLEPVLPSRRWRLDVPDYTQLADLWGAVALLPPGQRVLEAMRLIHPGIEGMVFVDDTISRDGRVCQLKLKGLDRIVSLQSLGDGLGRILAIALGLVSVAGGVVLLDEVETGLHYSVEYDLWRLVFKIAREMNVQVFATTHSWDCIEGFQRATVEADEDEGFLTRLQRDGDYVHVTTFDKEDLAVVARHEIEVR